MDELLKHNKRYRVVRIFAPDSSVHFYVRDAIIWRMDNETVDVTRFGDNESSYLGIVADIAEVQMHPVIPDMLCIRLKRMSEIE